MHGRLGFAAVTFYKLKERKMPDDVKASYIHSWAMKQLSYYLHERSNILFKEIDKAFLDIRTENAERILELEGRISDLESKIRKQS